MIFFAAVFLEHDRILLEQVCRVPNCCETLGPTLLALYRSMNSYNTVHFTHG